MNREIETEFVNQFIAKEKRERLLHELAKKRETAVARFCHGLEKILDKRKIVLAGEKLDGSEVCAEIRKRTKGITCYVIAEKDGEIVDLERGIEMCYNWAGGAVLVAGNVAFFKEEVEYGSPMKYILQS